MARNVKPVENYTNTCLVLGLVNLVWVLIAIWAFLGYAFALLTALGLNAWVNRLAARKRA
ncbi:hypothetical protein [Shimia biformata]|uniref:hypothetical protein n=1 Tax=Shimia biformata TaxID=1294299 RepID=UPI00194EDDA6|nr:hypothetical protein [Shimia biformata]